MTIKETPTPLEYTIYWEWPVLIVQRVYLFPLGKMWYVPLDVKFSKHEIVIEEAKAGRFMLENHVGSVTG